MPLEEDILKAAHAIRPYLKYLLEEVEAEHIDADLQEFLKRAEAGYEVDTLILQVLRQNDATYAWLEEYLKKKYPSVTDKPQEKFFEQLTSKIAMQSPLYRCPTPNCTYEWHRRSVAQPIQKCPTHQVTLVRVV